MLVSFSSRGEVWSSFFLAFLRRLVRRFGFRIVRVVLVSVRIFDVVVVEDEYTVYIVG